MKTKLIAAALLALAAQAQAAQYTGATGAPANTVESFSSASELFFDLNFVELGTLRLNFVVEAQDLSQPLLSFNALVRNLSGDTFAGTSVKLDGVVFAAPAGTVTTDGFQAVASMGSNAGGLWAQFQPGLSTELYIGNPLVQAGASDWTLDLSGRQVGDTFSITVAVPEPESYALMLAGLAGVAWMARRRRPQD